MNAPLNQLDDDMFRRQAMIANIEQIRQEQLATTTEAEVAEAEAEIEDEDISEVREAELGYGYDGYPSGYACQNGPERGYEY